MFYSFLEVLFFHLQVQPLNYSCLYAMLLFDDRFINTFSEMEVNSTETPLLSSNDHEAEVYKPKLTCSVSTMKSNFFTGLPRKLRSKIDPEDPFHIDFSNVVGLTRGNYIYTSKCFTL